MSDLSPAARMAQRQWTQITGPVMVRDAIKEATWEAVVLPLLAEGTEPREAIQQGFARIQGIVALPEGQKRRDAEMALVAEQSNVKADKTQARRLPEPRKDVPDGVTLLAEYEEGQVEDPPLTYRDLAQRYGCDHKLIYRRIQTALKARDDGESGEESPATPRRKPPHEVEVTITNSVVKALRQVEENCGGTGTAEGRQAVLRVLASASIHLGLISPFGVVERSLRGDDIQE